MAKKKTDAEKLLARAVKTFHMDPDEGSVSAYLATVEAQMAMDGELTVKRAKSFLRVARVWALYQIAIGFLTTPKLMKGTRAQQLDRWKKFTSKLKNWDPWLLTMKLPLPPAAGVGLTRPPVPEWLTTKKAKP